MLKKGHKFYRWTCLYTKKLIYPVFASPKSVFYKDILIFRLRNEGSVLLTSALEESK
jgi:hypothetical protein